MMTSNRQIKTFTLDFGLTDGNEWTNPKKKKHNTSKTSEQKKGIGESGCEAKEALQQDR